MALKLDRVRVRVDSTELTWNQPWSSRVRLTFKRQPICWVLFGFCCSYFFSNLLWKPISHTQTQDLLILFLLESSKKILLLDLNPNPSSSLLKSCENPSLRANPNPSPSQIFCDNPSPKLWQMHLLLPIFSFFTILLLKLVSKKAKPKPIFLENLSLRLW